MISRQLFRSKIPNSEEKSVRAKLRTMVQYNIPKGFRTEVFPGSESKFFLKGRPYEFLLTKAEGQTARLEIVEDGETYHPKRIE
jgi:hypothetical protein